MKKFLHNEKGSVMIIVALGMVAFMGMAAMSIDLGTAYVNKSNLQKAADAAALAGAAVSAADLDSTATNIAKSNGVDGSGTTITVEPYVIGGTTTTTPAYTSEQLAQQRTALTTEYNDTTKTSDADLIKLAADNSITDGLTSLHTSAELTGLTDAELIAKAQSLSIPTTTKIYKYTSAQLDALKINDMDAPTLENTATANGIYDKIADYIKTNKTPHYYKDEGTAKSTLRTELEKISTGTKNKDRNVLINEILAKLNTGLTPTISNKSTLITAIVNKLIADLANEVLKTGGVPVQGVKVTCTKEVPFTFAKVLGINGTTVTAHAVAVKSLWAGDALPFINLDGKAETSTKGLELEAWNKTGPGDKERISNDDLVVGKDRIQVTYQDGITFKKGKVLSEVKAPLLNIVKEGSTIYLISIKYSEITNYQKGKSKELKNGDVIPCEDTVLLKCEVLEDWDGTGSDVIKLKFIESYGWNATEKGYLSSAGEEPVSGRLKLVE
jgi:Flp pilus assembly protein TadG